jgi:hypothetical protein
MRRKSCWRRHQRGRLCGAPRRFRDTGVFHRTRREIRVCGEAVGGFEPDKGGSSSGGFIK